MALWDIVGPVMIGPSSSHTAGAARIGLLTKMLWGKPVKKAELYLRGSFLDTGRGHGTDKALIAGLLGMRPDDKQLKNSFAIAEENGLEFAFYGEKVIGAHPNSVRIVIEGDGQSLETVCYSVGGGLILLHKLNGARLDISCDLPTLIVSAEDKVGTISAITGYLNNCNVNIATMKVSRESRGGSVTMTIELDSEPDDLLLSERILSLHPAVKSVRLLKGVL